VRRIRKGPWMRRAPARRLHLCSSIILSLARNEGKGVVACGSDAVHFTTLVAAATSLQTPKSPRMLCIVEQVLAWLMGDGRELSLGDSKAMSVASYGDDDPAGDAMLGGAAGDGSDRVRCRYLCVPCRRVGQGHLAHAAS